TRRDITSHGAQGGTEHVKEKLLKVLMDGGERAILVSDLLQEKMEKRLKNSKVPEHCKFCRNNFEEDIYHQFKDSLGRVVCPVLSKHVCELCGARGPAAHTRKYCPYNPLTRGEPERLGFPPGMMPVDVLNNTLVKLRAL
ncbi:Zinc finger nanos-type, partial [Trinorchestia longiramus]